MHAAAVWLREVERLTAEPMVIDWRYFSLDQVNQRAGEGVNVWDRPAGFESAGLEAFAAAEAARRLGDPSGWRRLHEGLLAVRHEGAGEKLTRPVIERVAGEAGLDVESLRQQLEDPGILQPLAEQHQEAIALGVFGTPTLIFENGLGAYVRMQPASMGEEAVRAWEHVRAIAAEFPGIQEIKRPRKPRPVVA